MWKKIIQDKEMLNLINDKIQDITELLKRIDNNDSSFISGNPGIVLFFAYYSRYDPKKTINTEENLQAIYNSFQNASHLNFSSGIAGILYALSHLEKQEFFDFGNAVKDFDHNIFANYIDKENTLDYLHGSTGVILSLLEQNVKSEYNYLFDKWILAIEHKKELAVDHLKWKIDLELNEKNPVYAYSFGLSHGVPSIILILIKLFSRIESQTVSEYIQKSVQFLLDSRLYNHLDYYFPSTVTENNKNISTLSWCYGDLGCAYALYVYSKKFQKASVEKLAIKIFLKHCEKKISNQISDADFCHGSVGIGHLYARMYNYTNIEELRIASEYWYKATLEKGVFTNGLVGFKHYLPKEGWVNRYGLLEGISGIGLSFISAISDIEPKWDSALLLS